MLGDRVTTGGFVFAMLTRFSPVAVLSVLTPAALVATAQAQVQSVTPYYAFVTVDKATVRCGDNDRFYKVGELASSEVVVVDGEGNSWSRISYPSSFFAFAKVEDVKIDGSTATLAASSKLKAANLTAGFQSSWKSLLDVPLPAGTPVKVIEQAKEGESIVGYKIAVPDSARAFVETRVLRRATDSEVQAFKSKGNLASLPTPATNTPAASTPAAANPTPAATPQAAAPLGSPVNAPNGNPGVVPSTTTNPAEAVEDANREKVTPKATERAVGSVEALENRFKVIWKQEEISAEVGELMAEYQRTLDSTPAENTNRRRALAARISALKARVEIRETIRQQEAAAAKLDSSKTEIAKQLEEWERSRVYTIVGELCASTVYDGKNLPQMYRVVSVGGTSPRTLGYLKPSKDVNLDKMLGQVVGVIGEATMDRSLKLNIISPVKVDMLRSAPTTTVTTVDAAAPSVNGSPSEK